MRFCKIGVRYRGLVEVVRDYSALGLALWLLVEAVLTAATLDLLLKAILIFSCVWYRLKSMKKSAIVYHSLEIVEDVRDFEV